MFIRRQQDHSVIEMLLTSQSTREERAKRSLQVPFALPYKSTDGDRNSSLTRRQFAVESIKVHLNQSRG